MAATTAILGYAKNTGGRPGRVSAGAALFLHSVVLFRLLDSGSCIPVRIRIDVNKNP